MHPIIFTGKYQMNWFMFPSLTVGQEVKINGQTGGRLFIKSKTDSHILIYETHHTYTSGRGLNRSYEPARYFVAKRVNKNADELDEYRVAIVLEMKVTREQNTAIVLAEIFKQYPELKPIKNP